MARGGQAEGHAHLGYALGHVGVDHLGIQGRPSAGPTGRPPPASWPMPAGRRPTPTTGRRCRWRASCRPTGATPPDPSRSGPWARRASRWGWRSRTGRRARRCGKRATTRPWQARCRWGGVPALAALARDHATARAWVMRTPLGAAVLPDVHSTIARSEGETRAGRWSGAGGAGEAQSSFGALAVQEVQVAGPRRR